MAHETTMDHLISSSCYSKLTLDGAGECAARIGADLVDLRTAAAAAEVVAGFAEAELARRHTAVVALADFVLEHFRR